MCTIYIVDGCSGVKKMFSDDVPGTAATKDHSIAASMFGLILCSVMCMAAFSLHGMSRSTLFNAKFNQGCVDYAISAALAVCLAVSYMPRGAVFVGFEP